MSLSRLIHHLQWPGSALQIETLKCLSVPGKDAPTLILKETTSGLEMWCWRTFRAWRWGNSLHSYMFMMAECSCVPHSNGIPSPWRRVCTSSLKPCWSWRRHAGHPAGWRVSAGSLSCKRSATSPWMSSSCGLCTASSTISRSWSACANTTQLLMWISGTAEVLDQHSYA